MTAVSILFPRHVDNFTLKTFPSSKTRAPLTVITNARKLFQRYSKILSFSIESRRAIGALLLRVNIHLLVSALLSIPEIQCRFISSPVHSRFCYHAIFHLTLKFMHYFPLSVPPNPLFADFAFFPRIPVDSLPNVSRARVLRKLMSVELC